MKKGFLFALLLVLSQNTFCQKAVTFTQVSKKGIPIIFLPHIGCSSEMWKGVAEHYKKNYSIYLADFAGFNGQPAIDSNFTESYVKDLREFIQKNQLKNVILVGQNYGAFVAVKTAADKQLNIRTLVAVDFYPNLSMVLDPNISKERLEMMKSGIRQGTMQSTDSAFAAMQKQTGEMMNFTDPKDVERFVGWQLKSDRKTQAETLCEQFGTDLRPALKDNTVPILVFSTWYFAKTYQNLPLSDADDKLKEMYGETPRVTHAVTEEAKDFIANDQPEWFVKQMDQFLKQQGLGK